VRNCLIILLLLLTIIISPFTFSQEDPVVNEQQLENLAETNEMETEDDSWLQELEHFRKHRLNLNRADADELAQLKLTDLQIENLIQYRALLGAFIHIYELQAVPSWDINTIKKLLPFITVAEEISLQNDLATRLKNGEHRLLLRVSQVLERSRGFDEAITGNRYLGSPQRILFRYRYMYKNLLQFGVVGDKDAGEQILKGTQKSGFDFYSFHVFARKIGIIKAIAIGDFTVNMGQGLIHWQGLAFKKSTEITSVKRQSAVLRPYSSSGEFYFHRGAGITIQKGRYETTCFFSMRNLSGNLKTDTIDNTVVATSILNSGYHRTAGETADRNNLRQLTGGAVIQYKVNRLQVGLNVVHYQFSLPIQKRDEPYNYYSISGKSWSNFSFDYSYTYKNIHVFGEAAMDKFLKKAFVNGLLISVDHRSDLSFFHRHIPPEYQAVYGNAFTENTLPSNETGLFAGMTFRPFAGWRIDAYADIFRFPWLKYLVDAPSNGNELLAQVTYTPNRQVEIYLRYRNGAKQKNNKDSDGPVHLLNYRRRQNWRTHLSFKPSANITLRNRVELTWLNKKGGDSERGFLMFCDILYKPMMKPFSGSLRLQFFESGGYESRIYAYENDVLYSNSIPSFFDKGWRYYLNLNYDLNKKLSFWIRWSQSIYPQKPSIGSGLDEIRGNQKSEWKCQLQWLL
jgi:hypothetical protein